MTYYIDYRTNEQSNFFKRVIDKFFYRFSVIDVDDDKKCIYINKKYIDKKAYKKINKYLFMHNFELLSENAIIANNIQISVNTIKYIPKEKKIMKAMLCDLLVYLERLLDVDFRNESIYISVINDSNKEVIIDILDMFKSINIVTTRLGCMRKMENNILKHKEALISISNNRKKALKRAKILINFDFGNMLLNDFEINRNCIIINLNNDKINTKNIFHGCVINALNIDFSNRYEKYIFKEDYNLDDLYSGYIKDMEYKDIVKMNKKDNCKILKLIGNNGILNECEIVNNFINSAIKLDKTQKKD